MVDIVNMVDRVYTVDTVYRVCRVDNTELTELTMLTELTGLTGLTVVQVDRDDKVELSLAKPGGGEASPRGEASRESALPTSLLACPSGGWPLNLLEVRIVGTKVACNIRGWQYDSNQKTNLL